MGFRVIAAVAIGAAFVYAWLSFFSPESIRYVSSSRIDVWIDPDTGCEYFSARGWPQNFVPRRRADGSVVCNALGVDYSVEGRE